VGVRSTTGDWHVCRCLVVCCRRVALLCEPACAMSAVVVSSASTNSPRVCRRSPGWPHLHVCLPRTIRPACRELTVSPACPTNRRGSPAIMGRMHAPGKGISRSAAPYVRAAPAVSQATPLTMSPCLPPSLTRRRGSCRPRELAALLNQSHKGDLDE
jgi:hypothetical protein